MTALTPLAPAPLKLDFSEDHLDLPVRRAEIASRASIVAPAIGLAAGAALLLGGRRGLGAGVTAASLACAFTRFQFARWFTEQTPYEVERRVGAFELRRYMKTVRAETLVEDASWGDALDEGFRRLFRYISNEKIAMTVPVVATLGRDPSPRDRLVSFILPSDRTLVALPAPQDPRITLSTARPERLAVLRFSGRYRGGGPARKAAELLERVRHEGMTPIGAVAFAGYDPPTTLPWLRRNEVMVEVR